MLMGNLQKTISYSELKKLVINPVFRPHSKNHLGKGMQLSQEHCLKEETLSVPIKVLREGLRGREEWRKRKERNRKAGAEEKWGGGVDYL